MKQNDHMLLVTKPAPVVGDRRNHKTGSCTSAFCVLLILIMNVAAASSRTAARTDLCIRLFAPSDGTIDSTNFRHGNKVNFACNIGYTLIGNSSLLCLSDNRGHFFWSSTSPACVEDETTKYKALAIGLCVAASFLVFFNITFEAICASRRKKQFTIRGSPVFIRVALSVRIRHYLYPEKKAGKRPTDDNASRHVHGDEESEDLVDEEHLYDECQVQYGKKGQRDLGSSVTKRAGTLTGKEQTGGALKHTYDDDDDKSQSVIGEEHYYDEYRDPFDQIDQQDLSSSGSGARDTVVTADVHYIEVLPDEDSPGQITGAHQCDDYLLPLKKEGRRALRSRGSKGTETNIGKEKTDGGLCHMYLVEDNSQRVIGETHHYDDNQVPLGQEGQQELRSLETGSRDTADVNYIELLPGRDTPGQVTGAHQCDENLVPTSSEEQHFLRSSGTKRASTKSRDGGLYHIHHDDDNSQDMTGETHHYDEYQVTLVKEEQHNLRNSGTDASDTSVSAHAGYIEVPPNHADNVHNVVPCGSDQADHEYSYIANLDTRPRLEEPRSAPIYKYADPPPLPASASPTTQQPRVSGELMIPAPPANHDVGTDPDRQDDTQNSNAYVNERVSTPRSRANVI